MKANTKIRKDDRGLYVRAGGYVARPFPDPNDPNRGYTHPLAVGMGGPPYFKHNATAYTEGQEVNARHKSQTPCVSVRAEGHEEYWHNEYGR